MTESKRSDGPTSPFRWSRYLILVLMIAATAVAISRGSINSGRVLAAIARVPLSALLLPLGLVLVQRGLQSTLPWLLMPWHFGLTWHNVGRAWSAGELVNSFLPARCGDAVKVAMLVEASSRQSWAEIAGVFVAERVVETLVVLGLLLATGAVWVAHMDFPHSRLTIAAAALAVVLGLFFARRTRVIRQFLAGFGVLRRPVPVVVAAALGVVLWVAEATALRLLAGSFGLALDLGQTIAILALLNVAIAVPVTVANVGPYEAALVVGLTAAGLSFEAALAVAILHHALQLASLGVWGALLLGGGRLLVASQRIVVKDADKQRAIRHYERLAGKYDAVVSRGIGKYLRERERGLVLELAELRAPGTMMDVGCGGGFFALAAKTAGMSVRAVDAAPTMVAAVARFVDEAAVCDVEELGTERRYDRVVCAGVLDFVRDPNAAFARLARATKPSGRLVIAAPRRGFGGLIYAIEKRLLGIPINLYSLEWFRRRAEENGMTVVRHAYPLPNNLAVCLQHHEGPRGDEAEALRTIDSSGRAANRRLPA